MKANLNRWLLCCVMWLVLASALPAHAFYNPSTGRWLSRDPIGEAGDVNIYSAMRNSPIGFIDYRGMWTSGAYHTLNVHAISIRRVLKHLPANDLKILIDQQDVADKDQSTVGSYKHAMRDCNAQTVGGAKFQANIFVSISITMAKDYEKMGGTLSHRLALEQLGLAMHALQDSTSPEHCGFLPWCGGVCEGIKHGLRENFDPGAGSALDAATQISWDYFNGKLVPNDVFTLGCDARPIPPPPPVNQGPPQFPGFPGH